METTPNQNVMETPKDGESVSNQNTPESTIAEGGEPIQHDNKKSTGENVQEKPFIPKPSEDWTWTPNSTQTW